MNRLRRVLTSTHQSRSHCSFLRTHMRYMISALARHLSVPGMTANSSNRPDQCFPRSTDRLSAGLALAGSLLRCRERPSTTPATITFDPTTDSNLFVAVQSLRLRD